MYIIIGKRGKEVKEKEGVSRHLQAIVQYLCSFSVLIMPLFLLYSRAIFSMHSLQYTGFFPSGLKGTRIPFPHKEQFAFWSLLKRW